MTSCGYMVPFAVCFLGGHEGLYIWLNSCLESCLGALLPAVYRGGTGETEDGLLGASEAPESVQPIKPPYQWHLGYVGYSVSTCIIKDMMGVPFGPALNLQGLP
jgi:hypothetical protein